MYTAKNAYINEGCVAGNKYKIAKTDDLGRVVVIYNGYYNHQMDLFKLYPAKLNYPRHGIDITTVHTVYRENVIPAHKAVAL